MKAKSKKTGTKGGTAVTVGMDAKRALHNYTGLGNYSRYTIDAMSLLFPKNTYRLYAIDKGGDRARWEYLTERTNVTLSGPDTGLGRRLPAVWRTMALTGQLGREGVDVYHGLSNEIPLGTERSLPTVVTMHDVIWRKFPQDYAAIDRRLYDIKYGSSARRATRVIAISECTKRDLVEELGIAEDKIEVIYQGIDPQFTPRGIAEVEAVRKKYGLPARYYATVGTVQGRKNQLLAVKGLRHVDEDVKLVIAGRRTGYAKEIDAYAAEHGLSERIIWIEHADFSDIPAIYSGALFSSYTSRYEGFGLPVVESIACHTPVIACTGSCLEEAGGGGAIYVDPDDEAAFGAAAKKLADESYHRDKLVELGLRHIKRFDVKTFAEKTMGVYTKAILNYYL